MVVDEELAFAVEAVAVAWSRAWLAAVEGLELADAFPPHLLVPCHPDRPDLDFQNRVNGLTPDDAALVPQIVEWYEARGVRPWFELVPSDRSAELLAALTAAGAEPLGFHAVAIGRPVTRSLRSSSSDPRNYSEVDVRVVDRSDDEAFTTFARVRTDSHELPPEVTARAAADLRGWRTAPGATLYLASVDGEPAATAALTIDAATGIAYLADGATLPRFRGRGLQTALIRRRLHDAAVAGAEVATSQASVGSTSHRNLQREGLTSGGTKLVLRRGTQPHPHR